MAPHNTLSPAQVERDLLAGLNNQNCQCCGSRILKGDTYCRPCGEAVNRLIARGVYFADCGEAGWRAQIAQERQT